MIFMSANAHVHDIPLEAQTPDPNNNIERIEVLEDKEKILTLTDVTSPKYSKKFKRHSGNNIDFGYTSSAIWIRFTISKLSSERSILELRNPWISRASLFYTDPSGRHIIQEAGMDLPYAERSIRVRNIIFKLAPTGPEGTVCLFRAESDIYKLILPMVIRSEDLYLSVISMEEILFGIFLGIIGAMFFYNLFLFFSLRESAYLFYVLAILSIGTFQLIVSGLAQGLFWPGTPAWNKIIFFMPCCGILVAGPLTSRYLKTGEHAPRLHLIIMWISRSGWPLLASGALAFFKTISVQTHIILMSSAYIFLSATILSAAVICIKKRYSPAKYALIAFTSYLAGMIIFAFMINGILPGEYLARISIQQFTSAFGMILLSLGLADRINVIRRQQEHDRQLSHETELNYRDAKIRSQRLELELLKKTIQPHFMMNTLTAVRSWLLERPEKAVRLIDALADELRPILSNSDVKLIPLRDEIGLCRSHLVVMGLRLDHDYEFTVEGATGNETIPPLIFHTMVENAFTHGDPYLITSFNLVKESFPGGTRFIFSVESGDSGNKAIHEGIGIRYIRTRLEESYPECWSLECGQHGCEWRSVIEIREEAT